jgi:hypothetical protein
MSYANGLQGVGIAIPNPDINLHPIDTSIEGIFNPFWSPTPFVAPSNTPLSTPDPTTALAAAKSISWEMVAGIGAVVWLLTRKRR